MTDPWRDRSQAYLRLAVQELLDQLALHRNPNVPGPFPLTIPGGMQGTAFGGLARAFELDGFEQKVLLLAAADELRPPELRACCAYELGFDVNTPLQAYLSPYTLLSWCQDADPTAFRANRALLHGGLVRFLPAVDATSGQSLRPLQITPGTFDYLMGNLDLDLSLHAGPATDTWLPHFAEQDLCDEAAKLLLAPRDGGEGMDAASPPVIVNIYGELRAAQRVAEAAVAAASSVCGRTACSLDLATVLTSLSGHEVQNWLTDWTREARLKAPLLALTLKLPQAETDGDRSGAASSRAEELQGVLRDMLDKVWCPLIVVTREPLALELDRPVAAFKVPQASAAEMRSLWADLLEIPEVSLSQSERQQLFHLAGHFDLPPAKMLRVRSDVLSGLENTSWKESVSPASAPTSQSEYSARLTKAWHACCRIGQARMANVRSLAEHMTTEAGWDELILPASDLETLHDLVLHVQRRAEVEALYGDKRGSGIVALFSGPSGTGKTFAAQVLARELQLDLYRVNLSNLTSKWIGETEKNLEKLFDAADESGGVLLFDEADSVFGKRGDASDSNGRYANMQTNYLLQRLEAYRGLAILTTNLPGSIDVAFLRRIRFELQFREPDVQERRRLWERAFPRQVPIHMLDFGRLAQLKLTGANIKSAARHAVYLATAQGTTLHQGTVEHAVMRELRKIGRLNPQALLESGA